MRGCRLLKKGGQVRIDCQINYQDGRRSATTTKPDRKNASTVLGYATLVLRFTHPAEPVPRVMSSTGAVGSDWKRQSSILRSGIDMEPSTMQ